MITIVILSYGEGDSVFRWPRTRRGIRAEDCLRSLYASGAQHAHRQRTPGKSGGGHVAFLSVAEELEQADVLFVFRHGACEAS